MFSHVAFLAQQTSNPCLEIAVSLQSLPYNMAASHPTQPAPTAAPAPLALLHASSALHRALATALVHAPAAASAAGVRMGSTPCAALLPAQATADRVAAAGAVWGQAWLLVAVLEVRASIVDSGVISLDIMILHSETQTPNMTRRRYPFYLCSHLPSFARCAPVFPRRCWRFMCQCSPHC